MIVTVLVCVHIGQQMDKADTQIERSHAAPKLRYWGVGFVLTSWLVQSTSTRQSCVCRLLVVCGDRGACPLLVLRKHSSPEYPLQICKAQN
jgi:hypothetical protein